MKKSFLSIVLLLCCMTSYASSDLCDALNIIKSNEQTIANLNPARTPEKTEVYKTTLAAYSTLYENLIISGRTGSLKKLVADVRKCGGGKDTVAKVISGRELKNQWSQSDYDMLRQKISKNQGFAESMIHTVSWTAASIGGVCVLIGLLSGGELAVIPATGFALLTGGEVTSLVTAVYNRSPSFIKRIYLTNFNAQEMKEIKVLSSQLANKQMKELMK